MKLLEIEIQKGVESNLDSIVPIVFPLIAGAELLITVLLVRRY